MPEQPENAQAAELPAESTVDPAVATDAAERVAEAPEAESVEGESEHEAGSVEGEPESEPEAPVVYAADEVLLGSTALAQRALLEVTSPESVGSVIGHIAEGEHVLSLHFAADLAGYPGWHWSVTVARVDDGEPTVLETELMPGERALLAPEWVPWSERLADYRAAQEAAAAAGAAASEDELDENELDEETDDTLDDGLDDELDDSLDEDELDGIDIDALDEDDSDEDDSDEDDSDEDDSDDVDEDDSDEDDSDEDDSDEDGSDEDD